MQFKPIVLPKSMVDHVLLTAHDYSGHNGFLRMYAAIRCLYYWVGMKKDVQRHCKKCQLCAKHNIAKVKFEKKIHFKGAQPAHAVHINGSDWRVPSTLMTRPQVCSYNYLYAHQLCVLHPTEDEDS